MKKREKNIAKIEFKGRQEYNDFYKGLAFFFDNLTNEQKEKIREDNLKQIGNAILKENRDIELKLLTQLELELFS